MIVVSKYLVLALFLVTSSFSSLSAQEKIKDAPFQFRAWSGYSFQSVYFLGKTRNTTSAILGFGARKAIRRFTGDALIYYTADIIPYIYYDYPKRDDNNRFTTDTGFGFSPVGFIFEKQINSLFSYQLGISGSFILIESRFPTNEGRRLNFTFDPSFTLQTKIMDGLSLATGYKFHHISNAQTGNENPGIDSNFIFLSIILK